MMILKVLISPFIIFVVLIFASGAAYFYNKFLQKVLFWTALVWLFIIAVSPIPQLLTHNLERRYPVLNIDRRAQDSLTHILILGSGHSHDPDLQMLNQLGAPGLSRLTEGLRISKQLKYSKFVCSGSSSSGRMSEAKMLGLAGIQLGLDPSDTLLLAAAKDTSEEAFLYHNRFGNRNRLILVTSAIHMPRAISIFEKQGLHPIPAPTQHLLKMDTLGSVYNFKPSILKIDMMQKVIREYLGTVAFALDL